MKMDPSHGGDDKGAALAGNRWEKDETLALAGELRRRLEGRGIRVYAAALANTQPPAVGRFVPWESAQAQSRGRSTAVAAAVAAELRKNGLHVASLTSSLRPLNNLVSPAIAVEWAPGPEELPTPQIQKLENTLASVIASGIA